MLSMGVLTNGEHDNLHRMKGNLGEVLSLLSDVDSECKGWFLNVD